MNPFIESLKRLYKTKAIDAKKIYSLYDNGKITGEEKDYILADN